MVDSPSAVQGDLAAAAEILARADGVSWAYELLYDMAARHRFSDAWLVLDPGRDPSGRVRSVDRQVFGLGGTAVELETVRTLLHRSPGIYGEPGSLDAVTNTAIGAMCGAAFRASLATLGTAVDPTSGLASHGVVRAAIARAAAAGSRYGWSSTLVLLTTAGDVPPEVRWGALSAALRQAVRVGDEAGVITPGLALVVLGNAGPDAVRAFVARVRAALSAGGWDDVDLHAATARTPEESVDPDELQRLAGERLADAGVETPTGPESPSSLELELRLLPGVLCVAMTTPVVVISSSTPAALHDQVMRAVRARLPHASVRLLTVTDDASAPRTPQRAADASPYRGANGNGSGGAHPEGSGAPHAISATGPRPSSASARAGDVGARVSLLDATFDAERGTSEVSLSLGAARGTGRAAAGPLAGGAQATLNALEALAIDVPFYLVSSERVHGVPGEPVVVVLAPKRSGGADDGGTAERLGVASGGDDVEASSRATLGALNRHLAKNATAT